MTTRDWHKLTLIKWYFNHEIFRKRAERGKGWHVCIYIYIRTVHIVYSESLLHLVTSFTKQYNDT